MWFVLGIVALVLLAIYWKGKNAVWDGFALGIIGGILVTIVQLIIGNPFNLYSIGEGAIVGTLLGVIAELLGIISDKLKQRKLK